MDQMINEIKLISEYEAGSRKTAITLTIDGSDPDCPITFSVEGQPVFVMSCHEVDDFCAALQEIAP